METAIKKAIIKKILLYSIILMLLTTPIVFTGCSVTETPQTIEIETDHKIDEGVSSNEINNNQDKYETVSVNISGDFTVTVRALIPDYTGDDFTPRVAVVTLFQDTPFTVYVGEEFADALEVGKHYVFEIKEQEIGKIKKEDFEINNPEPKVMLPTYHLQVVSIREAKTDEIGLESNHLQFEKVADQSLEKRR